MPIRITFTSNRKIDFIYDATGKKWRKVVNDNGVETYRDYIDGAEYQNGQQDIIHFTEGYAQRDATTDGDANWRGWVYKYTLKDHLGNTRVTYSDRDNNGVVGVSDIEQVNHYYSFGLNMEGSWNGASGAFKFGYNGKEWNDDFGLGWNDYGFRMYDPAIGRFPTVDLLAETFYFQSPYVYAANDPVNMIDFMGLSPNNPIQKDKKEGDKDNSIKSTHTNSMGKVIAVYDDGDLGVYVHNDANNKEDVDKKRKKTGTTSGGGRFIGLTEYWDEFIDPSTGKEGGKILFNEDDEAHSWNAIIDWMHEDAMSHDLKQVGEMSKLYQKYDLKMNKDWAGYGYMTGRKLNGKWASARSAGNHLAGRNGKYGYFFGRKISLETYLKLAGALQTGNYSKWNAFRIVTYGKAFGEPPYYGEEEYTGRRIIEGWNSPQKKKSTP